MMNVDQIEISVHHRRIKYTTDWALKGHELSSCSILVRRWVNRKYRTVHDRRFNFVTVSNGIPPRRNRYEYGVPDPHEVDGVPDVWDWDYNVFPRRGSWTLAGEMSNYPSFEIHSLTDDIEPVAIHVDHMKDRLTIEMEDAPLHWPDIRSRVAVVRLNGVEVLRIMQSHDSYTQCKAWSLPEEWGPNGIYWPGNFKKAIQHFHPNVEMKPYEAIRVCEQKQVIRSGFRVELNPICGKDYDGGKLQTELIISDREEYEMTRKAAWKILWKRLYVYPFFYDLRMGRHGTERRIHLPVISQEEQNELRKMVDEIEQQGADMTVWEIDFIEDISHRLSNDDGSIRPYVVSKKQGFIIKKIWNERVGQQ